MGHMAVPMVLKNTNVKVATRDSPLTGEQGFPCCAVLRYVGWGGVGLGCAVLCCSVLSCNDGML